MSIPFKPWIGPVREPTREWFGPWESSPLPPVYRRIVAVDGGWVYCDDGTIWANMADGWREVTAPIPGTAAARQRETPG